MRDGVDALRWHICAKLVSVETPLRGKAPGKEVSNLGIDLAKSESQALGNAADGSVVSHRKSVTPKSEKQKGVAMIYRKCDSLWA